MGHPFQQQATIVKKLQLSPHVYEFTFQVAHPILFTPGQYATFIIDAQTRRQYSFASPCTNPKEFDVVVDVTPMGPGSQFFLERNVGDTVDILAPLGTFHLIHPITPVVFIATGTGIVPFRTMIEEYLKSGGMQKITLLWGLRHEDDIYWQKEFEEISSSHPNFRIILTLSQPSVNWQGKRGHVQEYIAITPDADYYLCGNKTMVSDIRERLAAAGVPETQVKFELFY